MGPRKTLEAKLYYIFAGGGGGGGGIRPCDRTNEIFRVGLLSALPRTIYIQASLPCVTQCLLCCIQDMVRTNF